MDEQTFKNLEARLNDAARHFSYPATPDFSRAEAVRRVPRSQTQPRLQRRAAWIAAFILILLTIAALATPTVRAAVLEFIQIGVVRILQAPQAPMPEAPVTAMPQATVTGAFSPTPTRTETTGLGYNPAPTPVAGIVDPGYNPPPTSVTGIVDPGRPTPVDLISILDLEGQTTLEEARLKVSFPIRLPSYPTDLGPPDHVILQDHDGSVLILVWTVPQQPDTPRLSLHVIEPGSWTVEKVKPLFIQDTTVNSRPAVWATGPYLVRLLNEDLDICRLIDGHVLIWVEDGLTYRLETDLPLAEAVRIAESLK